MLNLKTKKELSVEAHKLAKGNELVRHRGTTYIPADFETLETDVVPTPDRTIWMPLSRKDIQLLAAETFDTLFSSDSELSSFDFMVAQNSINNEAASTSLLIRTSEGLRQLTADGELEEVSGDFVPNYVQPMLNQSREDMDRVFKTVADWVDSEEEAHSLLHHAATMLAPGWSAVKYVLLLGEGRNGKSLFLKMLKQLIGERNMSSVTRQHMAEQSPVVCELNNKLLNVVFDGLAVYLKDSGTEKSLVAGEPVHIRKLYESTPTQVSTNALFMEGLNKEPKSNDKSQALQKRLVRYQFPNVYALDLGFEKKMLTEDSLGALLGLLLEHYVKPSEVATKLAPSKRAMELQLEHMFTNSLSLQFIKHVDEKDAEGIRSLLDSPLTDLVQRFQSWRVTENDLGTWAEPDVIALFNPLVITERRSVRTGAGPRKTRVVVALKQEANDFLDTLKGEVDDDEEAALVAD